MVEDDFFFDLYKAHGSFLCFDLVVEVGVEYGVFILWRPILDAG